MRKNDTGAKKKQPGKWINSRPVRWLTGQPDAPRSGDLLHRVSGSFGAGLSGAVKRLHMERLLEGSVFLHPGAFCLLAVALLPFMPTMALLALTMAAALALGITYGMNRQPGGRYTPTLRWAGLLAAVYLVSIATSVNPEKSLNPGLLMAVFMLFSLVVFLSVPSYGAVRRAFAAVALGAVAVSLYGFWQRLNPAAYQTGWVDEDMFSSITFRVYSTFSNPNVLGEYFLLVIPFTAALALTAPNCRKKLLWGAAAAMMCACLLLTYSRGCYLGLLLGAAIFLVLLDRRFLIPMGILLVLSPLYVPASIWDRLLSIGNMGDTSTNYRVSIWVGTVKMLKDFWLCGVGPGEGAFNSVYPLYRLSAIEAPHSHNLYLQLLCDTGIVGLLVFLAFAGSLLRSLLTTLRHCRCRETRVFSIAGIAACSGFLLQSFTDYTFYNYRVMLLFFALAGLCLLLRQEEGLFLAHGTAGKLALVQRERPMVLQILSDSNLGGAGRYLLNLFSAWDQNQYDMALVIPQGAVMEALAEEQGIPVITAQVQGERSMDFHSLLAFREICMLLRPEVVQTHGSLSGRIAARACGAKIIYTRHSVFPVSPRLKSGLGHLVSRWITGHYADLCLAVSPAAADNLLELGAKPERIVTVMNGAAPLSPASPERQAQLREQYGLPEGVFTAGMFARLEEYKGQTTVLEAAAMLKEQNRRLKILICGAGPMEEVLKDMVREMQLEDTVVLGGFVTNVDELLSLMDVQLNASTGTEATSLSLIEGMSMGLPTVASSYGGNPYLIHDGQEGLLFRPGDAVELADCLSRLMEDTALRQRLSEQARKSYEEHYTAKAFASGVEAAYQRVLEGRKYHATQKNQSV